MILGSGFLSQIGIGLPPPVIPAERGSCIFCNVSPQSGFKIAYEDEAFLAFEDIRPACAVHYLVVPRKHIGSVRELRSEDVQLVKNMENIGHSILDRFGVPSDVDRRRMGFHIPPFNSVGHLHLHVHGLPYNFGRGLSYYVSKGVADYSKGFSWFVEATQAIRILERGGQVGVGRR